MKVVYLSPTTDFNELELSTVEAKSQNKYGAMQNFKDKIELVTSEQITDYHVYESPDSKDKVFLCVKSPQLNGALNAISEKLARERNHVFKEEKDAYYIRMNPEQAALVPKNQQINVSVNVCGVFTRPPPRIAFCKWNSLGLRATHWYTLIRAVLPMTLTFIIILCLLSHVIIYSSQYFSSSLFRLCTPIIIIVNSFNRIM